MLVLKRSVGERIVIGDTTAVIVQKISGQSVSIGIEAPSDVKLLRGELHDRDNQVATGPTVDRGPAGTARAPLSAYGKGRIVALPGSAGLSDLLAGLPCAYCLDTTSTLNKLDRVRWPVKAKGTTTEISPDRYCALRTATGRSLIDPRAFAGRTLRIDERGALYVDALGASEAQGLEVESESTGSGEDGPSVPSGSGRP